VCRFAGVLYSIVHGDVGIVSTDRSLLFWGVGMLLITFLSFTVKYGIVSTFGIFHTFPFGSVIILGLLLETDIVVKTCGLKYPMLSNSVFGNGSTRPYYKNGSAFQLCTTGRMAARRNVSIP